MNALAETRDGQRLVKVSFSQRPTGRFPKRPKVLHTSEVWQQAGSFDERAHRAEHVSACMHRVAANIDRTGVWLDQPDEHSHHSGLACSIRSEQPDHLPRSALRLTPSTARKPSRYVLTMSSTTSGTSAKSVRGWACPRRRCSTSIALSAAAASRLTTMIRGKETSSRPSLSGVAVSVGRVKLGVAG